MSESDEHRNLVVSMVNMIEAKNPHFVMLADMQKRPGDPVPPKIGHCRPDVYAYAQDGSEYIIAEAKTQSDLDTIHTREQISAFLSYLEGCPIASFILGVSGCNEASAKTMIKFTSGEMRVRKTQLQVYDGHDYWRLDHGGTGKWRLD